MNERIKNIEIKMPKPIIPQRSDYPYMFDIQTRWSDNDAYGHVNNVVYYSYFDSITNRYLIEQGVLDIASSQQIGLMVGSQCYYHASVSYPEKLLGGFAVSRIGTSSVDYALAIFKQDSDLACAHGNMTHVFVDRYTQKPMPISGDLLSALSKAKILV